MLRQGARASEHLSDFFWCGDGVCTVEQVVIISPTCEPVWRSVAFLRSWRSYEILGDINSGLSKTTHDGFAIADD
jgi:hypothetical protein